MNKMKLLYEIITILRSKEQVNGMLQAKVEKDQIAIFSVQNDFEKHFVSGKTKVKMNAEMECEGWNAGRGHWDRGRFDHREILWQCHHFPGGFHEGFKGKLTKLALMISVLQALQVEEGADKTVTLSLHSKDIPEDMRQMLRDRMKHQGLGHHRHGGILQEFGHGDMLDVVATLTINAESEIDKALIIAEGAQQDAQGEQHRLKAQAEVNFAW